MQEGWRLQVTELKVSKRNEEALGLIRQAIAEGDMSARVIWPKWATRPVCRERKLMR
jgi:hypothetical protein